MYLCVYVWLCMAMYVWLCMYGYVCMYVWLCMYVCMAMYVWLDLLDLSAQPAKDPCTIVAVSESHPCIPVSCYYLCCVDWQA